MSGPESTVIAIDRTRTAFFPMPTPWPAIEGCNAYFHPVGPNSFAAFDPVFGRDLATAAASCFPPQVSSWWLQPTSTLYSALGPTFVCPESYSTVATAQLTSSAGHKVYCCPPNYTFVQSQPNVVNAFPSQCRSLVTPGQTFTIQYQVSDADNNVLSVATGVTSIESTGTVWGVPINGFNLATAKAAGAATQTQSTSLTSTSSSIQTPGSAQTTGSTQTAAPKTEKSSSSPSVGVVAGASVAAVVVAFLAVAVFVWCRRYGRRKPGSPPLAESLGSSGKIQAEELSPRYGYSDSRARANPGTLAAPPVELFAQRSSLYHELPGSRP